jgi:cytochrome c-type biogenesis protein CcmH
MREDALIAQLRNRLALMDPHDERTRQGYLLLGTTEENRANWRPAADAYRRALALRFDAALAARTAEAIARGEGAITGEAKALYQKALDAAPRDAPWRPLVEQRLAEAPP